MIDPVNFMDALVGVVDREEGGLEDFLMTEEDTDGSYVLCVYVCVCVWTKISPK